MRTKKIPPKKGPDGVTLKPGRIVIDGVTCWEKTGTPCTAAKISGRPAKPKDDPRDTPTPRDER